MARSAEPIDRSRWIVPALLLCLAPLCFLGYGSDNDTYGVLQFGAQTWRTHVLATSRDPGYWTYEAVVFVLAALGGWVLSNLASLAVTATVVWRFLRIAARLRVGFPATMAACLLVTPVVAIAATSTLDYMWSLLCIVLAAEALFDDRLTSASLFGALAISFRGANCVVVSGGYAAAIGWEIYRHRRLSAQATRIVLSGLAAALLGCSTYVFSYRWAHDTMAFLAPQIGPAEMWTWKGYVGRFAYKCLYALGPLAMAVCAYAGFQYRRGERLERSPETSKPTAMCCGFLAGNLALFLKFPVEISYLIPAVFFFLLLAGATIFARSRSACYVLLGAIFTLNFVTPILAQPDIPGRAQGGHLHLGLGPGTMVDDLRFRRMVMGCSDADCWIARSKLGHH